MLKKVAYLTVYTVLVGDRLAHCQYSIKWTNTAKFARCKPLEKGVGKGLKN